MATTKKKRNKAYRPRPTLLDQLHATQRLYVESLPVREEEADRFRLAVLTSLDGITRGTGGAREWNTIVSALRHAHTLAHDGTGEEIMPALIAANDGMIRARERFERTGRMGFDGDALRDIRLALDLWFEQIQLCNIGEVDQATRAVVAEYDGKVRLPVPGLSEVRQVA
ncbi:MAG: hypothetical protein ACREMA_20560 [Longimicrobiales bacterium]